MCNASGQSQDITNVKNYRLKAGVRIPNATRKNCESAVLDRNRSTAIDVKAKGEVAFPTEISRCSLKELPKLPTSMSITPL